MLIRKLNDEELKEALLIAWTCFHNRKDASSLQPDDFDRAAEQWAAFSEDGVMMGRMQNNHFRANIDGNIVENGGIGGVSTLPEYRESGAIREIFRELLPAARKSGEVISTLYPFSQAFYRKFGYETVVHQNVYEMKPEVLSGYHFSGTAALYRPGDPVTDFTRIYQAFTGKRNLSFVRDDQYMAKEWLHEDPKKSRCFPYLLSIDEKPVAYVIFTDIYNNPQAILQVDEAAFINREGFMAILGFLARFSADYGTIRLPLPTDIDLLSVIQSPKANDIQKKPKQDYMIRVVNAEKLLQAIEVPEGKSFVIRVQDELLKENCGCFRVTGKRPQNIVETTAEAPDLCVSEKALGQMACGAIGWSEALLRADVLLFGNEELLQKVFHRKAIYIMDHF